MSTKAFGCGCNHFSTAGAGGGPAQKCGAVPRLRPRLRTRFVAAFLHPTWCRRSHTSDTLSVALSPPHFVTLSLCHSAAAALRCADHGVLTVAATDGRRRVRTAGGRARGPRVRTAPSRCHISEAFPCSCCSVHLDYCRLTGDRGSFSYFLIAGSHYTLLDQQVSASAPRMAAQCSAHRSHMVCIIQPLIHTI